MHNGRGGLTRSQLKTVALRHATVGGGFLNSYASAVTMHPTADIALPDLFFRLMCHDCELYKSEVAIKTLNPVWAAVEMHSNEPLQQHASKFMADDDADFDVVVYRLINGASTSSTPCFHAKNHIVVNDGIDEEDENVEAYLEDDLNPHGSGIRLSSGSWGNDDDVADESDSDSSANDLEPFFEEELFRFHIALDELEPLQCDFRELFYLPLNTLVLEFASTYYVRRDVMTMLVQNDVIKARRTPRGGMLDVLRVAHSIRALQATLVVQLYDIYPIAYLGAGEYSIGGIKFNNADVTNGKDEELLSTALGYIAHFVFLLAKYLNVNLRYAIVHLSSRSYMRDDVNDPTGEYPLYKRGVDKDRFDKAFLFLRKDVEQVRAMGFEFVASVELAKSEEMRHAEVLRRTQAETKLHECTRHLMTMRNQVKKATAGIAESKTQAKTMAQQVADAQGQYAELKLTLVTSEANFASMVKCLTQDIQYLQQSLAKEESSRAAEKLAAATSAMAACAASKRKVEARELLAKHRLDQLQSSWDADVARWTATVQEEREKVKLANEIADQVRGQFMDLQRESQLDAATACKTELDASWTARMCDVESKVHALDAANQALRKDNAALKQELRVEQALFRGAKALKSVAILKESADESTTGPPIVVKPPVVGEVPLLAQMQLAMDRLDNNMTTQPGPLLDVAVTRKQSCLLKDHVEPRPDFASVKFTLKNRFSHLASFRKKKIIENIEIALQLSIPLIDVRLSPCSSAITVQTIFPGYSACMQCHWSDKFEADAIVADAVSRECPATLPQCELMAAGLASQSAIKLLLEFGEQIPFYRVNCLDMDISTFWFKPNEECAEPMCKLKQSEYQLDVEKQVAAAELTGSSPTEIHDDSDGD
ncbi:hypothetical protein DYB32_005864 [Aphanomyces invadans]|uniref:C2 domain-containing protein n=1 Tax=Aphanomyces invadans TaxID=157072 RepID=A0A3R6VVT9_9STRA|nr:hypothetical protein DYB32_005864 [Aphanomyces invadans]